MAHSLNRRSRLWAGTVFPLYLIGLGWIVFAPGEDASKVTGVVDWVAARLGASGFNEAHAYTVLEFLANIALFVPFGMLMALVFVRLPWWLITTLGCATSITIELIQLALPTRYSTLSDVIANTAGAAAGALLIYFVRRARHQNSRARA